MKHLLIFTMAVLSFSLSAQKADWGRIMEADNKQYSPTIVGEDDRAIYAVSLESDNSMFGNNVLLRLEKYDSRKLNRKMSKLAEVPAKKGEKYSVEKVAFVDGKFVLFGSLYDKKSKTFELTAFTYDADRGNRDDEFEIFTEEVEKSRRRGDFDVHTSKNNQKLLIHFTTYYKETDITVEKIKLFDKEMKLELEKEYKFEGNRKSTLSNLVVDDEGSIYFVKNGNEVAILDATANFEEWSEEIVVDGMESNGYINGVYFTLNNDNDLVLIGQYMTKDLGNTDEKKNRKDRKKNDTQVEGIYFMKVNGFSKETEVSQLNKFDQDFLDQFKSAKDVKKGNAAEMNDDYNVFDFFFKEDGGVVFVTEQQYVVRSYRNDALVAESYYFNDLVTFNFSADGELVWANRIPKSQRFYWQSMYLGFNQGSYGWSWWNVPMTYKGHFGYMAGLSDDKLYIVYNDNKKNVQLQNESDKLTEMRNIKKAVPVIYSIDLETGIKKKEMELSLVAANAYLKPNVNFQRSQKDALYIFGMKKKSFRYGKIEFDEKGRGKRTARK